MMATTAQTRESRTYGATSPITGLSEAHTAISGKSDAGSVDLTTIAVTKRFWEEISRASSVATGLEAISGSTSATRALLENADLFWDGRMVGQDVVNHAIMVEVV